MISELANFAARLRASLVAGFHPGQFEGLALELFALQFAHNSAYRKICAARQLTPAVVEHWSRIPSLPTAAFKELELSCLAPADRTAVFHSSGTTGQRPSRHFHGAASLGVYEASLWAWCRQHIIPNAKCEIQNAKLMILTPPPAQAPHSSLVYMFETVRRKVGGEGAPAGGPEFVGRAGLNGDWTLDWDATLAALTFHATRTAPSATLLLGTAFSFVQLLDFMAARNLRFALPAGSRVMETGGYKNRSRSLPKAELHKLITDRLGVPASHIVCEYGMSELSSQAYVGLQASACSRDTPERELPPPAFHFPPWARVQIISPETGREVAGGQSGLIRVFDLANVFSVLAVQTEDLGLRRGDGFELLGRVQRAEPRGCSLMTG